MTQIDPQQPPQPQKPKRSTGKFVTGIVLTVIGVIALLGRLASVQNGTSVSESPAIAIGGLVAILAVIVVGIVLISTSKKQVR